jgi:hypothetical protein
MAFEALPSRGPTARCTILLPGELDRLIEMLGGVRATAKRLEISVPALRRYRAGKFEPPLALAERMLAILGQPSVEQVDKQFLLAHRRPRVSTD